MPTGVLQKAQPQKVVRVECNGLHAVVISRFLYDCTYFGKEVMAMIEAVTGTAKTQPRKLDQSGYKSTFEVRLYSIFAEPSPSKPSGFLHLAALQASFRCVAQLITFEISSRHSPSGCGCGCS